MKTFHVSILFATVNGPLTKSYTLKATTPDELEGQIAFLALYELGIEYAVCAQITEVKNTVDFDLALAN